MQASTSIRAPGEGGWRREGRQEPGMRGLHGGLVAVTAFISLLMTGDSRAGYRSSIVPSTGDGRQCCSLTGSEHPSRAIFSELFWGVMVKIRQKYDRVIK